MNIFIYIIALYLINMSAAADVQNIMAMDMGEIPPPFPDEWFCRCLPVFEFGRVPPEGVFKDVGHALYEAVGYLIAKPAEDLRNEVANTILANRDRFSCFLPSFQTVEDLASQVREGYSCGDLAEWVGLTAVVRRLVAVLDRSGAILNSHVMFDDDVNNKDVEPPIFLLFSGFSGQFYPIALKTDEPSSLLKKLLDVSRGVTIEVIVTPGEDAVMEFRRIEDITCPRHNLCGCWSCFRRVEMTEELALSTRNDDGVIFVNSKGYWLCSPHWMERCEDCRLDFRAVNSRIKKEEEEIKYFTCGDTKEIHSILNNSESKKKHKFKQLAKKRAARLAVAGNPEKFCI